MQQTLSSSQTISQKQILESLLVRRVVASDSESVSLSHLSPSPARVLSLPLSLRVSLFISFSLSLSTTNGSLPSRPNKVIFSNGRVAIVASETEAGPENPVVLPQPNSQPDVKPTVVVLVGSTSWSLQSRSRLRVTGNVERRQPE